MVGCILKGSFFENHELFNKKMLIGDETCIIKELSRTFDKTVVLKISREPKSGEGGSYSRGKYLIGKYFDLEKSYWFKDAESNLVFNILKKDLFGENND